MKTKTIIIIVVAVVSAITVIGSIAYVVIHSEPPKPKVWTVYPNLSWDRTLQASPSVKANQAYVANSMADCQKRSEALLFSSNVTFGPANANGINCWTGGPSSIPTVSTPGYDSAVAY